MDTFPIPMECAAALDERLTSLPRGNTAALWSHADLSVSGLSFAVVILTIAAHGTPCGVLQSFVFETGGKDTSKPKKNRLLHLDDEREFLNTVRKTARQTEKG